jgi:AcrR family transcriptional regulator
MSTGGERVVRRRVRNPAWTRQAIIDALLGLINEGEYFPTARGIAQRAGISERSVFTHFRDFEDLRDAAGRYQTERILRLAQPIGVDGPLAERVDALLAQCERIFALQAGVRIVAIVHHRVPEMLDVDRHLRAHLSEVFAPELAASPHSEELLDIVEAIAGWGFRHQLEVQHGAARERATEAARRALLAVLAS